MSELASELGGELDADLLERSVTHVATPKAARESSHLALLASTRHLVAGAGGHACLLVSPALAGRLAKERRWVHPYPWWAFAGLLERAAPAWAERASADIAPTAHVAPSAIVHPGAVIGARCRVADHAVIHGGVVLGDGVVVAAGAVIGSPGFGFAHGPAQAIRRIPQLGGVSVGDQVEIGPLSTIDAGTLEPTVIGAYTKLDAQVHIGHNVIVGARCLMAAQVGIAGSVRIGDSVWIGGQAGVSDHVRIGDGARIAAKSGVISDIAPGATVAGFPAVARFRWLRGVARLAHATRGRSRVR